MWTTKEKGLLCYFICVFQYFLKIGEFDVIFKCFCFNCLKNYSKFYNKAQIFLKFWCTFYNKLDLVKNTM